MCSCFPGGKSCLHARSNPENLISRTSSSSQPSSHPSPPSAMPSGGLQATNSRAHSRESNDRSLPRNRAVLGSRFPTAAAPEDCCVAVLALSLLLLPPLLVVIGAAKHQSHSRASRTRRHKCPLKLFCKLRAASSTDVTLGSILDPASESSIPIASAATSNFAERIGGPTDRGQLHPRSLRICLGSKNPRRRGLWPSWDRRGLWPCYATARISVSSYWVPQATLGATW